MKKYISPEVEVSVFNKISVIATSLGSLDPNTTINNPTDVCARRRFVEDFDEDDDF